MTKFYVKVKGYKDGNENSNYYEFSNYSEAFEEFCLKCDYMRYAYHYGILKEDYIDVKVGAKINENWSSVSVHKVFYPNGDEKTLVCNRIY